GPQGMSLFERGGRLTHLPTAAREVYDVTGAGDTVVSVVALGLAAGAELPNACYLSNHAAGIVIREVGTASCTREQLIASIAGSCWRRSRAWTSRSSSKMTLPSA